MTSIDLPIPMHVVWPSGTKDIITRIEISDDLRRVECYTADGMLIDAGGSSPSPRAVYLRETWNGAAWSAWTYDGRIWMRALNHEPIDIGSAKDPVLIAKLDADLAAEVDEEGAA